MSETHNDERLDTVLAEYIETAGTIRAATADNDPNISTLRARCLLANTDLQHALQAYFDDEDSIRSEVVNPQTRIPQIDRYEHVTQLDSGAMGIVYRAFDKQLQRWVALKMSSSRGVGSPVAQAQFRYEAQIMARMRHPHIISVFDVGEYDERTYLAMDLIDGINLEHSLARFQGDQTAIARLMIDIARAVHHAHQREILHRDLKPANILIGLQEHDLAHAYVCDFGLARPTVADGNGDAATSTQLSQDVLDSTATVARIEGTAAYMAPEQARGERATTLSDIYGLGAILYCLLTGKPPYRGATLDSTLDLVKDPMTGATPPRQLSPLTHPSLEAICRQCMHHEPTLRYASAEGMAKDLERWLCHRATEARPLGSWRRAGLWCRRNPVGTVLMLISLGFVVLLGMEFHQRLNEPRLAQMALAEQRAETLALRLTQLRRAIAATAADSGLASLISGQERQKLQDLMTQAGQRRVDLNGVSPFESWFIIAMHNGQIMARWPSLDPRTRQLDLRSRDYITRLQRPLPPATKTRPSVSNVFRSQLDGLYKFGISTPVRGADGELVGALVATVTTSAQMGFGSLSAGADDTIVTALLARREAPNVLAPRTHPEGASDYLLLLHPAYARRTDPVWLPQAQIAALTAGLDEDYHDPARRLNRDAQDRYGGRWTAVFAPVSNSDFIVVVQQRRTPLLTWKNGFLLPLLAVLLSVLALTRSTVRQRIAKRRY